jgi:hypothetical protein
MSSAATKTAHLIKAMRANDIPVSIERDKYVKGSGIFPIKNRDDSQVIFQYNANENLFLIPDIGGKLVVDRGLLPDQPYGVFCNMIKLLKSTLLLIDETNNEHQK